MRSRHVNRIRVLTLSVAMLFVSSPTWAQETGVVTGTVIDTEFQTPIPSARASLVGTLLIAYTDNDGVFTLTGVPPGEYTLLVEAAGFGAAKFTDLELSAGQTLNQDAVLSLARILEEVTVTASRTELTLKETPQDVSVITAEMMERTSGNTPVDYLDRVPGVDVSTSGAGIGRGISFVQINGYDNTYVREMIDGVDVSGVSNNWGTLQEFPVELIDKIEIVKGASSAAWGSGMAGVINVVTKNPRSSDRPLLNLSGGFSTWGEMDFGEGNAVGQSGSYGKAAFDLTGMLGKLGYFVYGSRLGSGGFVEDTKQTLSKVGAKLNYDLSPRESLSGFFNYNLSDGGAGHIFAKFPGTEFWFWNYRDDLRIRTLLGTARYVNNVAENLEVSLAAKASSNDVLTVRENVEDSFLGAAGETSEFRTGDTVYGLTGQANYKWSDTGDLVAGIDYYSKKGDFTDLGFGELTLNEYAPFANVTQRLGNVLLLNVGLRYDGSNLFEGQLSPQIGVVANMSQNTLIRVSTGRAYQVPQLWQLTGESFVIQVLPNPDLKPERAWLYSAGFETNELRWLWFKASGYLHKITDGIVTGVLPDGRFQWINENTFTRKGVSLELGIQHDLGIFASIGYNYNKHVDTTGDDSEVLLWMPTRTWKTTVGYSNPSIGLDVYVAGRNTWYNQEGFVGEILQANDAKWILDLKISKQFRLNSTQTLTVHANVYNLTDTLFWERIDQPYARRWVDIGVKFNLR